MDHGDQMTLHILIFKRVCLEQVASCPRLKGPLQDASSHCGSLLQPSHQWTSMSVQPSLSILLSSAQFRTSKRFSAYGFAMAAGASRFANASFYKESLPSRLLKPSTQGSYRFRTHCDCSTPPLHGFAWVRSQGFN